MPNYIKNRISLKGNFSDIEKCIDKYTVVYPACIYRAYDGTIICKDKEGQVGWFNEKNGEFSRRDKPTLIGLPDGWEFELTQESHSFPDFNKIKPQPENIFNGDLGDKEREMCKKEGRPNWYDWNRSNWGTKWNLSTPEKESYSTRTFITAWVGVPSLINELSKNNPNLEINYEFADEDTGYNCASFIFKNGVCIDSFEPEGGSKDAYELSFKLRPESKEYYELVEGNYKYKED